MTKIPKMFVLDLYHEDIDATLYTLLLSIYDESGNDSYHDLSHVFEIDPEYVDGLQEAWDEQIERSKRSGNTFHDREEMQKFTKNPPSLKDALLHLKEWLKKHGVKETSDALVKIWW